MLQSAALVIVLRSHDPYLGDPMFKKVLLAVDGSESAKHAATTALKLGLLRGAELVLVTAFDVARATYGGLISLSREQSDSLHASLRNRVLEPARSALASAGATSRGLMVEGHPVVALADEARRQQADLIVVARRGPRHG
jgi:nucleotide-binding universal stress UspA family protein